MYMYIYIYIYIYIYMYYSTAYSVLCISTPRNLIWWRDNGWPQEGLSPQGYLGSRSPEDWTLLIRIDQNPRRGDTRGSDTCDQKGVGHFRDHRLTGLTRGSGNQQRRQWYWHWGSGAKDTQREDIWGESEQEGTRGPSYSDHSHPMAPGIDIRTW